MMMIFNVKMWVKAWLLCVCCVLAQQDPEVKLKFLSKVNITFSYRLLYSFKLHNYNCKMIYFTY